LMSFVADLWSHLIILWRAGLELLLNPALFADTASSILIKQTKTSCTGENG
jgi:hypothetical protein